MEREVERGDVVLMLSRTGERTVHQAHVTAVLGDGLALDLTSEDGRSPMLERAERLVAVLVRENTRYAAEGIVIAAAGDQLRVQLLSEWNLVERRLFARFETSMRVLVAAPGASDPLIPGRVIDMSAGGMRLTVQRPVPSVIDIIVHGPSGTRLPAELVEMRRAGKEFELRTQFLPLSTMQRRFVQEMVSALAALSEHGRNLLAG